MRRQALALAVLLAGESAHAAPAATGAPPPRRVLVLPLRRLVEAPPELVEVVQGALSGAVRGRPGFEVVSASRFLEQAASARLYGDRLALERDLVEVGVRDHERMRLAEAIRELDKARGLFAETRHDWVAPAEVAEAHLTLALAYLESGRRDRAHLIFKDLLALDPFRELAKGYYSQQAIDAFGVARADFVSAGAPSFPVTEAARLGASVGARWVLSSHLTSRARGGTALIVTVYDGRARRVLDRESVPADAATLPWRVDRLTSRLLACITPDTPEAPREDPLAAGRWQLGVDVSTSFYGARPVREAFANLGLAVRGDYLLRPHLLVASRLVAARSTGLSLSRLGPDGYDYEDLHRTTLDTLGLLLAIGPRMGSGDVTAHAIIGLEAVLPGAVRVTRDPGCKWGPPYPCQTRLHDPDLLVGVAGGMGVSLALLAPVLLQAELQLSYYLAALDDNELNLPVRLGLGLGYRF